MLFRIITVFFVSYALAIATGFSLFYVVSRTVDLSDLGAGVGKNIGFALNMAAFFLALFLATTRGVQARLGRFPGPLAYDRVLVDTRLLVCAGIGVCGTFVDTSFHLISSQLFTGNMIVPAGFRIVGMAGVYGFMTFLLLVVKRASGNELR